MKTRYCTQCGGKLETRSAERGPQRICSNCGMPAYENPLPVAAAVILNERREVLLVKRRHEPQQGQWCLPTGFAETGESIGAAALRELHEETGLTGEVRRLLSVDSLASEFYGDLLFVSFEIDRRGGQERAGDDASELAYFPLDRVPRLAFAAHELALRACEELHRDEWAIQDSFTRLDEESKHELLSDALVTLITDCAAEITRRWFEQVRVNPSSPTYAVCDPALVQNNTLDLLAQFAAYLRGDQTSARIPDTNRALGRERRAQGFALHELISALTLLRKEIWAFICEQHALERLLDVYRVMELSRRTALFFDRALYYMVRGYEED